MQTSNRAELRAVLAALNWFGKRHDDLEFWTPKEYAKLVVAADSTYVVDGAQSRLGLGNRTAGS